MVLLIFVVFVPIHSLISSYSITFQTKEDLVTSNFMIEKYDWNSKSIVIADLPCELLYFSIKFKETLKSILISHHVVGLSNIVMYDSIVYSVDLASRLNMSNISVELTSQRIMDRFDVVYN